MCMICFIYTCDLRCVNITDINTGGNIRLSWFISAILLTGAIMAAVLYLARADYEGECIRECNNFCDEKESCSLINGIEAGPDCAQPKTCWKNCIQRCPLISECLNQKCQTERLTCQKEAAECDSINTQCIHDCKENNPVHTKK
ncbi:unnamed protein product [Lymnaea stagnalis]|uniref:Uncharacterized protein n=1 Tax=Lymnaea stagnalis TaxID=6523 RepID=A0AAV2HA51_LYMST